MLEIPKSFEKPRALDGQGWLSLADDLAAGLVPPAYDSRLLDSYYYCALKDVPASTLAVAQALEIARTEPLNRVGLPPLARLNGRSRTTSSTGKI